MSANNVAPHTESPNAMGEVLQYVFSDFIELQAKTPTITIDISSATSQEHAYKELLLATKDGKSVVDLIENTPLSQRNKNRCYRAAVYRYLASTPSSEISLKLPKNGESIRASFIQDELNILLVSAHVKTIGGINKESLRYDYERDVSRTKDSFTTLLYKKLDLKQAAHKPLELDSSQRMALIEQHLSKSIKPELMTQYRREHLCRASHVEKLCALEEAKKRFLLSDVSSYVALVKAKKEASLSKITYLSMVNEGLKLERNLLSSSFILHRTLLLNNGRYEGLYNVQKEEVKTAVENIIIKTRGSAAETLSLAPQPQAHAHQTKQRR